MQLERSKNSDDQLFHFEDNWLQLWSFVPSAQHPRVSFEKMHASTISTCICTATAWLSAGTASAKFFASRQACKAQRSDRFNILLIGALLLHTAISLASTLKLALNCPCCAQRKQTLQVSCMSFRFECDHVDQLYM